MEMLNKVALYAHIAAGFTALIVGLIPMFSEKGGKTHRLAGKIFTICMLVVSFSAVWLVMFKGSSLFLFFIAILTFQSIYFGNRLVQMKGNIQAKWYDWLVAGVGFAAGLAMFYFAVKTLTTGSGVQLVSILFFIFGIGLTVVGWRDVQLLRFPERDKFGKHAWFFGHLVRMMTAYIATLTAFFVVNVSHVSQNFYFDLAAWILPGVVLGGGVTRQMVINWRKKFKMA